jgi:protein-S-isoprenylcysteine O-methyltransferase Ste14
VQFLRAIGFLVNTILIYLGLPLLGWGIRDLKGFFSLNQRLGYAIAIIAFSLAVGHVAIHIPESIRGGKGQEGKLVFRQRIVHLLVVLLLFGGLVFLPFGDRHNIGVMSLVPRARWAGLILFCLGFGLIFWSSVALGRLYSPEVTIQENHQLITSGLYRFIRHPRYLGGFILGIGFSFLYRSWIGLVLSFAFFVIILFRIRDEEAVMHREFGQVWEAYCERSWRLIPFLY